MTALARTSDNPIMAARRPTVMFDLDAHCRWLNGLSWVVASGQPYFVGVRDRPDGGTERYLGR
jgi:hypothetical protein